MSWMRDCERVSTTQSCQIGGNTSILGSLGLARVGISGYGLLHPCMRKPEMRRATTAIAKTLRASGGWLSGPVAE